MNTPEHAVQKALTLVERAQQLTTPLLTQHLYPLVNRDFEHLIFTLHQLWTIYTKSLKHERPCNDRP